jgi:hypothetical protein
MREARGSAYEAFVAMLQAIERLLRGVVGMMLAGHDSRSPCRSAMGTRIVARPPDVCARIPYSPRMADRPTPASTDSPEAGAVLARALDAIIARCGEEIAVAASLGLGKPR